MNSSAFKRDRDRLFDYERLSGSGRKVTIEKFRGEVSLVEQDKIENVS
jgi:hypothetical protein